MLESKILKKLHQTEKATFLGKDSKYVFEVNPNYNKIEIKNEIEKIYKVKITGINVIHLPSKKRRVSRQVGYESRPNKVIVTLRKGDKINEKI